MTENNLSVFKKIFKNKKTHILQLFFWGGKLQLSSAWGSCELSPWPCRCLEKLTLLTRSCKKRENTSSCYCRSLLGRLQPTRSGTAGAVPLQAGASHPYQAPFAVITHIGAHPLSPRVPGPLVVTTRTSRPRQPTRGATPAARPLLPPPATATATAA